MIYCGYDSYGCLTVSANGKRYHYFGVEPWVKSKVRALIYNKQYGGAWKMLAPYSAEDVKRIIKERSMNEKSEVKC